MKHRTSLLSRRRLNHDGGADLLTQDKEGRVPPDLVPRAGYREGTAVPLTSATSLLRRWAMYGLRRDGFPFMRTAIATAGGCCRSAVRRGCDGALRAGG